MSEHLVVHNNAFAQWTLYTPLVLPWFLCFVDSFDLSNLSRFSRNLNFFLVGFMILLIFHEWTRPHSTIFIFDIQNLTWKNLTCKTWTKKKILLLHNTIFSGPVSFILFYSGFKLGLFNHSSLAHCSHQLKCYAEAQLLMHSAISCDTLNFRGHMKRIPFHVNSKTDSSLSQQRQQRTTLCHLRRISTSESESSAACSWSLGLGKTSPWHTSCIQSLHLSLQCLQDDTCDNNLKGESRRFGWDTNLSIMSMSLFRHFGQISVSPEPVKPIKLK